MDKDKLIVMIALMVVISVITVTVVISFCNNGQVREPTLDEKGLQLVKDVDDGKVRTIYCVDNTGQTYAYPAENGYNAWTSRDFQQVFLWYNYDETGSKEYVTALTLIQSVRYVDGHVDQWA